MLAAPERVSAKSRASGWERWVLKSLAGLSQGQLVLHWPDSRQLKLGGDRGEHRAVLELRRPEAFFRRCALAGDIGFAESYLEGEWETPDLTAVIAFFIRNVEATPTLSGSRARAAGLNLFRIGNRLLHLLRPNSRRRAAANIREHYDLSNEFFRLWLDPSMMYSAARFTSPELSLEQAQAAKNELLCQKLQLGADDRVLEIGTGWGGWALHAAASYGCRVTTLTISRRQYDLARQRVADAGLADRIEVRLQDYRDLPPAEFGGYDKLVSIEMLEAVGHRYLPAWCEAAARALRPDGVMALQFITCPDARYGELRRGVDFIQKHIFPGSLLLSLQRLSGLLSRSGNLVLQHLEDFGPDYARTLQLWRTEFNRRLPGVRALGFDDRFIRKWNYYLAYCEAAFAMRNIGVVHAVYRRPNQPRLA